MFGRNCTYGAIECLDGQLLRFRDTHVSLHSGRRWSSTWHLIPYCLLLRYEIYTLEIIYIALTSIVQALQYFQF
jgi:hypothetical protein